MDKPFYAPDVYDFCKWVHADDYMVAVAAPCFDLRTMWYAADRPAWLLWLFNYAHRDAEGVAIMPEWHDVCRQFNADATVEDKRGHWASVEACDWLRARVACPFRSLEPVPPCDPVPDGDLDHDVIGTRDASGTVTIDGRDYIPADEAQAEIATVAENRQYWVNVATFILYGAYAGILVGYLLARLVRRQRNDARDCERGSEWLEVRG